MENYTLKIIEGENERLISASGSESILTALQDNGIAAVHAPCGGKGLCRQCTVTVTGKVRPTAGGDVITAQGRSLLSCLHVPAGDCTVILPETKKMEVLTRGAGDIAPCGKGLGAAIDIGTTTVAVYLYDLAAGKPIAVHSDRNAQRAFGADVISRIQACEKAEGLAKLRHAIRSQLSGSLDICCAMAGRARSEIEFITIAANTVMEHIFMDLSPVTIGVAPFKTLSLFGDISPAGDIFEGLAENAQLYMCPALAGYVGGDITAGILSSGAGESEGQVLFIDIGTNGEMGIGNRDGFICCATAAGPAFEGAEIDCGMDASPGAINRVWLSDGEVKFTTIGDAPAVGLCGSGLIDALCTMLLCEAVQENGRMSSPDEVAENIGQMLRPDENGRMRFYLTDKVYVSGEDVRQLQMAKSAIRAGIETLLETKKLKCRDIDEVIIAGGFGAFMDVKSACAIGLLPPALMGKTRHAGNTAGGGAALALAESGREALSHVESICRYLELSGSALFMEKYIECMIFDEAEEVFD